MEQPNPGANDDSSDEGDFERGDVIERYEELLIDHEELNSEDMLQQIFRNDPSIVEVSANLSSSPAHDENDEAVSDWWGRAGNAIGANTHVKSLLIDSFDDEPSTALPSFCWGVANNRSIESLFFIQCDLLTRDTFSALSPLFEHNSNLRSVVVDCCFLGRQGARSLASRLMKCRKKSSKHISLYSVDVDDEHAAEFIESMSHHHGLENLTLGHDKMGRNGCTALANLINNSETKLQELSLSWCKNIDDECMCILSHALGSRNSTIRVLELSSLGGGRSAITHAGWCAILAAVCNPMCSLEELRIPYNKLGDQCLAVLGHAMAGNTKLKCLDITDSKTVTTATWRAFCDCLQSPTSALEKLCIERCNVTDEGAMAMATTLMTNRTLKCLNISDNPSITPSGWRACFNLMKNSTVRLEELVLHSNSVDDDGVAALVKVFSHSNTLKILNLDRCRRISTGGWQQMSTLVQHPNTALTELSLEENVNDEVIIRYSNALSNTSTLKVLSFGNTGFRDISARGWEALSDALCNTSSISDTHSSNHTLETLLYQRELPQNVCHLLDMNRNESKREVARQKILEVHFSCPETDIGVFAGLEWKALPRAIEWIGRDHLGFSLLYHLSRSMASLFELHTKSNKRKFGELGIAMK